MDRQTVERRREYVQNIRNSFYEENGMQKRETREVDDSAPEMGLAAALTKKVYHVDQDLYILSSAIGKVLFERKPLGELFVKPKRPMKNSDDGQLTLWENFFGQ